MLEDLVLDFSNSESLVDIELLTPFILGLAKVSFKLGFTAPDYYVMLVEKFCTSNLEYSFEEILILYTEYLTSGKVPERIREITKFADKFSSAQEVLKTGLVDRTLKDANCANRITLLYQLHLYLGHKEKAIEKYVKVFNAFSKEQETTPDDMQRFVLICFELEKLREKDPVINLPQMQKLIFDGIVHGKVISLVHMKCLRYLYPKGRLKIATDIEDLDIETIDGEKYTPRSEKDLLPNLKRVCDLFAYYHIPISLDIYITDNELDNYGYIPKGEIEENKDRVRDYELVLAKKFEELGLTGCVVCLSEFLDGEYEKIFVEACRIFRKGEKEKILEPAVNKVFETQGKISVYKPSRDAIREERVRVYAGYFALQSFFKDLYPDGCIVFEDPRGNENYIIARGLDNVVPCSIFFTKLRS